MFDFFKKKSYKIEDVDGMKKLVVAKKYAVTDFDTYIKNLTDAKDKLEIIISALTGVKKQHTLEDVKNIPDYMKKNIDKPIEWDFDVENKILKVFNSVDIKKKIEDVKESNQETNTLTQDKQNKVDTEPKKEEEFAEPKKEENAGTDISIKELFKDDTSNNNQPSKEEGMEKKTSLSSKDLKRTADKAPGSSKYRAEGIKERLLEINKEVVNVKTPGVTYVGGVGKDVITPGPKSTMVRVKEEVVRPNNVVEHVKIKIMRDEGEKERLLPDRNIKMPKGDVVVKKAGKYDSMDPEKVEKLDDVSKEKLFEDLKENKTDPEAVIKQHNVNKTTSSLYDEVMFKVFADKEFNDVEVNDDTNNQTINELEELKLPNDVEEALKSLV